MKIIIVVGNRPQFVKAAALWREIGNSHFLERSANQVSLLHTGQHYDANMSDVFFKEMDLPRPNHFLGIGGCHQGAMTGRILEEIEKVLLDERPDCVALFGDTNSTLAGALAAVKLHIPVAHIEAGLRCFNKKVPEEVNRIVTDHCSHLLFTPTDIATSQLLNEGLSKETIFQVGDIMYDCFLHYSKLADQNSTILSKLGVYEKKYALTTIHRAENTDNPQKLNEILEGLFSIAKELPIVFPLHPRTKKTLQQMNLLQAVAERLILCDPLGYLDMVKLERNAQIIITDSGGVQKEAYFCQVPCLILRGETEWTELVKNNYSELVPPDKFQIQESFHRNTEKKLNWQIQLYGNGSAAKEILDTIEAAKF